MLIAIGIRLRLCSSNTINGRGVGTLSTLGELTISYQNMDVARTGFTSVARKLWGGGGGGGGGL